MNMKGQQRFSDSIICQQKTALNRIGPVRGCEFNAL